MHIPFINQINGPFPLGTFLLLALVGMFAGHIAKRVRLPEISGQVCAGILLGPSALAVFSEHALAPLNLLTEITLGVMTFIAGTHLSFKKLHNASRRVFVFAGADMAVSFLGVFLALSLFGVQNLSGRLLLAALAIATAPGTVVGIIQAKRARGVLVKTVIGVMALNNIAAIVAFEICKIVSIELLSTTSFAARQFLGVFVLRLIGDLALGVLMGWLAASVSKHQHEESGLFSTLMVAILANVVICQYLPLSTLLVNMATGVTFSNLSYHTRQVSRTLEGFNGLIFGVFFTLAGTHLDLSMFTVAGLAGAIYVTARFGSKNLAVAVASRWVRVPAKITKYLGLCLIPQAGLAIGLVLSLSEFDVFVKSGLAASVTAVTLVGVVISELIGPLTTERSLDLANESGQAATRLIDFLQEEYIVTGLEASDKWDAIEKMCRFLVKTNHLRSITFEKLRQTVLDRENEMTTGVGRHLAVPHARIPASEHLMGVVGILSRPIDFDSPDGKKVDVICLVATPEGKENLHQKVLSVVAKIFTNDASFHDRLLAAATPAEVYDLFQCAEVQKINYFLDDAI